jgi:hypothetical protein
VGGERGGGVGGKGGGGGRGKKWTKPYMHIWIIKEKEKKIQRGAKEYTCRNFEDWSFINFKYYSITTKYFV